MRLPSPADAINSPCNWIFRVNNANKSHRDLPLGEKRTALTAAEWKLRVARHSTRGCLGATVASSPAIFGGIICGWTIHIWYQKTIQFRVWQTYNVFRAHPNVFFFSYGYSICLSCIGLFMPGTRMRLFVGNRLEVAGWDRLAVVKPDFKSLKTHCAVPYYQTCVESIWESISNSALSYRTGKLVPRWLCPRKEPLACQNNGETK